MIRVILGDKGSGKTKTMCDMANEHVQNVKGSVVFLSKNNRLTTDLKYNIRLICMEDYKHITDSDEYIGFIYGIIASDHDIEYIFIDSILKHADFSLADLPEFIDRLKSITEDYGPKFVVSISATKDEMVGVNFEGCEILN